jgi:hypothetical protein
MERQQPRAASGRPARASSTGESYSPLLASDALTTGQVIELEMRTTERFTRDASAEVIRKLYAYVEPRIDEFDQLAECVPYIEQAAKAYAAGEYNVALSHAYDGYRSLTAIRALVPELPSL